MIRTEHTTFRGAGGDELSVRLDLPDAEPVAYALFAHCFTCSKDVAAAARISRGLVERGFGVLRFDFTGLGSSGGEVDTTFSSDVEDLVRAAAMLRERYIAPTLLVGHSLGGAAVLAAARAIPEATAVATIGAPFDPGIDDAGAPNLTTALQNLGRALLVLHSARDEIVGIDNARRIFTAARHPKSFVSLDEADHLLNRPEDATYVADVLAAWASRYLPTTRSRPAARIEQGTVVVAESGVGRFGQTIRAGRHRLVADEPVGDDTGPTPYDLLLAALGACTSMTIRMYADRKGWPLDHVSVQLTHNRVHADNCREQIRNPCTVAHIDRTLELTGLLTEQQRARLLTIAERCPVHRTLTGEIRVATRLRPSVPEAIAG
jgi:putative redox protein